jgi:hypothetical protein
VTVAQGMRTEIGEIALPAIMHGSPMQVWQNTHRLHGWLTPLGVHGIGGQSVGAGRMQPVEFAIHLSAGFIKVHHGFLLGQMSLDHGIHRLDLFANFLAGFDDRAFRHTLAVELTQSLAYSLEWDHLVLVQVHYLGFDLWAILGGLGDPFGKVASSYLATIRTTLDLGLMLGHLNLDGRQIEHLAFLDRFNLDPFQSCLAVLTTFHPMYFHSISMAHCFQGCPRMAWLATPFPAMAFSLAFGSGFIQSITGRRFTAVPAILHQPIF